MVGAAMSEENVEIVRGALQLFAATGELSGGDCVAAGLLD
jgi:hypothetical protein